MRVTIIGAGRMGRGIGTRMVVGGNQVELIDTDPAEARALADELNRQGGGKASAGGRGGAIGGEVVVLAIPYGAVADVVAEYRDQLAGRVVVDITNPVDFATFEGLVTSPERSAGEEVAGLLPPGTPVVKAFNTTFARTLVAGEVAGQKLDVLIAGDDQAAKDKVAALVEAGGLRAIDVGPLRRARQLEQLGFLHMSLQDRLGTNYGSAIKLLW
ncbi:MAG TPA: NADPH-dependent F420 reductase [Candidatus Dormibacteraeota bacterium]|nr:NADPH-dependent F420 reductase [Candidatus Dormibacteraeota bacterium]